MLGTVTRAGKALDLFTPERPRWGATAVAHELSVAKSQAHELLMSLSAIGLLRRVPGGQYRLGWRTLALGRDGLRGQFPDTALRIMEAFAVRCQEPVQLVALDRDRLAVVAQYTTRGATDEFVPTTLNPYLHCSAPARILLADQPPERLGVLLSGPLVGHTTATQTSLPALLDELDRVRAQRLAVDHGEVHENLRAVAVPIRDTDGHLLAALTTWTTARRWERNADELTRATIGVGQRIRTALATQPTRLS